jgi:NAD(P)-dependent dehydrogenase (short-subunit alcohol dehydrogenase family)
MSKTWFITGSSRGIGAEIAKAALVAGDNVVATGRNLEQLQKAYAGDGDRVLPLVLDVGDEAQASAAVDVAVARFGRIDVLVNNAGYGQLGLFEENDHVAIEKQFATNVYGTFHVTRAVLPVMRRQRSGHIMNLSSIGGFVGYPGASIYCAAKFAVEGFSESLAPELAQFGIHVTIVEPGFFRTDFLDGSSVRYGTKTIGNYGTFGTDIEASYNNHSHQQAGDPAKLGKVLVDLASEDNPPLRYLAGSDAVDVATAKLARHGAEIARWRDLSISTDGDF